MKLKLKLNESDLRALKTMLLTSIEANPMEHLRANPADYLVVADLTAVFHRVELKLRDMTFFGSTRSTSGKIVTLSLTRPEAISLYILLTDETDPDGDNAGTGLTLTYEATLVRQLIGLIHRTYFI